MDEKRKTKRLDLIGTLVTRRLDVEEGKKINIDIVDLSRRGIGFYCVEPLIVGSVYEVHLQIWTKEIIHTFFKIIRVELKEDKSLFYGATFVGMSEVDAGRIDDYYNVKKGLQEGFF